MKKNYLCVALAYSFLLFMGSSLYAQNNISINNTGNSNYTGAILDLSNQNTNGSTGFLLPYVTIPAAAGSIAPPITGGTAANLSGLMVFGTPLVVASSTPGPGIYYWNNTT